MGLRGLKEFRPRPWRGVLGRSTVDAPVRCHTCGESIPFGEEHYSNGVTRAHKGCGELVAEWDPRRPG